MAGRKPVRLRRMTTSSGTAASPWRIALWNGLLTGAALALVFAAGEAYLRATWPFAHSQRFVEFVPGVGLRLKPRSEVRWENTLDFWTTSRANSLGFLDREPISPQRAAASCHVAIVGDSFVEAPEVPIADKLQVRLERMAREQFPEWDLTTAAYGFLGLGQVQQLPWWDQWIRHRPPKLVVLVFVHNDFLDNQRRYVTAEPPFAMARRTQDGSLELFTPGNQVSEPSATPLHDRAWQLLPFSLRPYVGVWARHRFPIWREKLWLAFPSLRRPEPAFVGAGRQDFTAFAFDEWLERTRPAGASLVLLAATSNEMRLWAFDQLTPLAAARDIPVVDQLDYILRQGGSQSQARFRTDWHWTPQGHQWAAEALLEWLAANPSVCDG